jgi:hypothetical protein
VIVEDIFAKRDWRYFYKIKWQIKKDTHLFKKKMTISPV